ncbi:MAG: cobalt transport protein CbiN [Candidatus Magnetominusculus sp. LBB02]|nr:cobalt transport protein CbiN [Candidatus Magnetominusculus sp. LBB02]
MFTRKNISLALLFILIALGPALISMANGLMGVELMGTDDKAQTVITEVNTGYVRWIEPLWVPPGKTVETLLFVFQAAIGAGFIFLYIMRKRGRR